MVVHSICVRIRIWIRLNTAERGDVEGGYIGVQLDWLHWISLEILHTECIRVGHLPAEWIDNRLTWSILIAQIHRAELLLVRKHCLRGSGHGRKNLCLLRFHFGCLFFGTLFPFEHSVCDGAIRINFHLSIRNAIRVISNQICIRNAIQIVRTLLSIWNAIILIQIEI